MRSNRDGKPIVPGNGGYEIEMVEVTGPPDRMMAMPPAKSRGRLIPMGTGEDLPDRPAPGLARRLRSKVPLVPTKEEIDTLPRWAKVAFAARCARRVLPAFGFLWKQAPEHHLNAVADAVNVTERAAVDAITPSNDYALAVANAITAAELLAKYAAARAAGAVIVACHAARAVRDEGDDASRVIFETATIESPLTAQLRCIRRDFVRLKKLASKEKWTDDTPVPPDVFGPMWPEGVAPYWAVEPPPPSPAGS